MTDFADKVEMLVDDGVKNGRMEDRNRGLAREFKLEIAIETLKVKKPDSGKKD